MHFSFDTLFPAINNNTLTVYRGRLAPAPTGALHLGNARTFLIAWLRARMAGGSLLLRLEDLDHPKVKSGAARQVYQDLAWLGLDWDFGPADSNPLTPVPTSSTPTELPADPFVQSENTALYRDVLKRLHESGKIYPCVCTRKDLENFQSAPNAGEERNELAYPGTCHGKFATMTAARIAGNGREPSWRFRIDAGVDSLFTDGFAGPQESRLSDWSGDFLVGRGDLASYQLAVVVDDARMGVTEVVRGDDLLASTHRQLALYAALGVKPPSFYHLPLVVGPDGRRLAKRHGDSRLSQLRERKHGPERILGWLAWSCGWSDDYRNELSLTAIKNYADFSTIPRKPVAVDSKMLEWLGFSTIETSR